MKLSESKSQLLQEISLPKISQSILFALIDARVSFKFPLDTAQRPRSMWAPLDGLGYSVKNLPFARLRSLSMLRVAP